jgi:hypothetical protein
MHACMECPHDSERAERRPDPTSWASQFLLDLNNGTHNCISRIKVFCFPHITIKILCQDFVDLQNTDNGYLSILSMELKYQGLQLLR